MTTQVIKRDTDQGAVISAVASKPAGQLIPAFASLNRIIWAHQLDIQVVVSFKVSVGEPYEIVEIHVLNPDPELAIDLYMWEQEFK